MCKVNKNLLLLHRISQKLDMNTIKKYVKQQPLSILLITAIWILCMFPVPETPLNDVAFIDKWTHLVMYISLVVTIMGEYGFRHPHINYRRLLVGGLLLPIIMGGLVELAQAYLTNGLRSGDWLDFVANSCGALLGCIIGIPLARFLATRCKGA